MIRQQFFAMKKKKTALKIILSWEKEMMRWLTHIDFLPVLEADEDGYTRIYAHCPRAEGIGLAVYNRILRAAAFNVIEV